MKTKHSSCPDLSVWPLGLIAAVCLFMLTDTNFSTNLFIFFIKVCFFVSVFILHVENLCPYYQLLGVPQASHSQVPSLFHNSDVSEISGASGECKCREAATE